MGNCPLNLIPPRQAMNTYCTYCLGGGKIIGSFLIFWAAVKTCPECKGSGVRPESHPKECES